MVKMREMKLRIGDDVYRWPGDQRGAAPVEEFAARILEEHIYNCVGSERLHGDIIKKLDELEGRIKSLNKSLAATGKR